MNVFFSSSVGIMVPYLIQTLPVISDISVNCVFLYRLGKHRVGGAVVVNLWGGCVTVDKDPRSRSPTLGLGQGGGDLVVRNLLFSALCMDHACTVPLVRHH